MRWLARVIYTRWLGWSVTPFPKHTPKCVIAGAPHTSYWDFVILALMRKMIALETNFVAKKELFVFPFGIYFRWMGGVAIDRSMGANRVERIAKVFGQQKLFRLAIAPEGTRKAVEKWKTGFYYIAHTAQVPLVMCRIDWGAKKISFSEPMKTTGNIETDLPKIKAYFVGAKGKSEL